MIILLQRSDSLARRRPHSRADLFRRRGSLRRRGRLGSTAPRAIGQHRGGPVGWTLALRSQGPTPQPHALPLAFAAQGAVLRRNKARQGRRDLGPVARHIRREGCAALGIAHCHEACQLGLATVQGQQVLYGAVASPSGFAAQGTRTLLVERPSDRKLRVPTSREGHVT